MKKRLKRTPWFSASINPTRPGEYEVVRTHVDEAYPKKTRLKWTGRGWVHTKHSSNGLFEDSTAAMIGREGDKWRGLAEDSAGCSCI